ncbi:MAG: exonuclease domain-containing protein [Alphaproteobacteria bacterium]|nr:exonuclease domain-containing protein [Alphaproteobacteria bacterium]MCZ6837787.1 exonuclease domain-containing protein [Alphaproteobacteria bacterium]
MEYTSWEGSLERGWSRLHEHREVVQIGAVRLDAGNGFDEVSALDVLVRPQHNPVLSDYFVDLTGITNDRLAAEAGKLASALGALTALAAGAPLLTNGDDGAVVAESCALIGVDNPLADDRWFDIAPALQRLLSREKLGSAEIPALLGLPAPGPAHDALADACAIAAGLRHLRKQQRL